MYKWEDKFECVLDHINKIFISVCVLQYLLKLLFKDSCEMIYSCNAETYILTHVLRVKNVIVSDIIAIFNWPVIIHRDLRQNKLCCPIWKYGKQSVKLSSV